MRRLKHKLNIIEKHGGIKRIRRINSAYGDEKYILTAVDNEKFLLKIYSLNRERAVQLNKDVNNSMSNENIKTPLILEVGKTETDLIPYELMTWVPGQSLDHLIEVIPEKVQYTKGIASGEILRNIHALDYRKLCLSNHMSLSERIKYVIERYDLLKRNGQPTYKGDIFRDYVLHIPYTQSEENVCMLHGDYHVGNIIEGEDGALWVIDWIYNLIGNPTEDFVRIFVSADKSSDFARGQIDGYFEGPPPFSFWQQLKMYAAIQQLEILSYSLGKLPDGRTVQEHQHHIVYEQYDRMESIIPLFYSEKKGEKKNEH